MFFPRTAKTQNGVNEMSVIKSISVHKVDSIVLSQNLESTSADSPNYHHRRLTIENEDGERFTLYLFSDISGALDIQDEE